MNFRRRVVFAALVAALAAPMWITAQDLHPSRRPSPMGMARISLGDTYVRVVYNRPYKRDRNNIFGTKESGALVPFGERWRTGANEATEITVTRDVLVAGQKLPAGTYSVSTTPGADTWKVHFNSKLGLSGLGTFANNTFTPVDLALTDVLVVSPPATQLPADKEVDQLTFEFEKTGAGADLVLRWIRTEVRVPIAPAP
ncbi:MAG: DUF2911 domain-containing protein [Acidobacteriota bacterium]|nr:DUF2911 domain-containing protein [Acidobacteriota bacterium]